MSHLQDLVDEYWKEDRQERKSLIAKCKIVATIRSEQLWLGANYKSFDEFMAICLMVKHAEANMMAHIGENISSDNSTIVESLKMSHLKTLAGVKPEYRHATIEALSILPANRITARAINRLSEVLEELIETGVLEVLPGEQIAPNALTAIQAAYLLEANEAGLRAIEHRSAKNPPLSSFNGISLAQALNYSNFATMPLDAPVTVEIYETRIVIRVMREVAKV